LTRLSVAVAVANWPTLWRREILVSRRFQCIDFAYATPPARTGKWQMENGHCDVWFSQHQQISHFGLFVMHGATLSLLFAPAARHRAAHMHIASQIVATPCGAAHYDLCVS